MGPMSRPAEKKMGTMEEKFKRKELRKGLHYLEKRKKRSRGLLEDQKKKAEDIWRTRRKQWLSGGLKEDSSG